ncbi:T9SS type A sorting domain-containing protein [Bacteroidia bacterium]|nr:T9SS type A sorting domain-containing protein [Bacteroidia bacterium]
MRKITFLSLFVSAMTFGQTITDTLVYMQYNLLNYRNITSFCTASNNGPTDKEDYMRTIVGYAQPDILAVNEIVGDGGTAARRLLDNALNQDGRNFYKQAAYTGNSNLTNMLYYNQNKLVLHAQDQIDRATNNTTLVRLIDVYELYYLDQSELDAGDTTWLVCYVAHLKASTGSANVADRAKATEAAMVYHEANYDANCNYIFSGDFNMYTSNEEGFINLTGYANRAVRFKDPINKPGSWNNSGTYASIHTQSTRTSGSCHSSGGLDDRFDIILCGQELLDNSRGVKYITGSYEAMGNDGNHFNSTIIATSNTSVPADVLTALYNMSDHLPVVMKMGVVRTMASVTERLADNYMVMTNPVENQLQWKMQIPMAGTFSIADAHGREVFVYQTEASNTWKTADVSHWNSGVYYVSFITDSGQVIRRKIIKT